MYSISIFVIQEETCCLLEKSNEVVDIVWRVNSTHISGILVACNKIPPEWQDSTLITYVLRDCKLFQAVKKSLQAYSFKELKG